MESIHSHRLVISQRGFSLIELLVVLAIIMVVTAIAFSSQSNFNRTLIVANTAYDIALTLRNAETYGLGSRAAGTIANTGYGIDFQKGSPTVFTLFADIYPSSNVSSCHPVSDATAPDAQPGDCAYESNQSEKVVSYNIGNGISVSDFCAFSSGAWQCASSGLLSMDILFSRPNPTAFISVNGVYNSVTPITAACLTVSSPQGGSRFVSVNSAGRITANATSCP